MVFSQESYIILKLGLLFVYAWWLLSKALTNKHVRNKQEEKQSKLEEGRNKQEERRKLDEERNLFECLPEDTLIQILERLPSKPLFQLICVSKDLQLIVKNSLNFRPKVLISGSDCISRGSVLLSSIDNKSRVEDVRLNIEYRPTIFSKLEFNGSCNGFVIVNAEHDFYLWNPLTKYTKKLLLRSGLEKVRLQSKVADPFVSILVLGLCHDSYTDEYKVVMVAREEQGYYVHAYVFVVRRGAVYRATVDLGHYARSFRIGPVLNGYLHSLWDKSAISHLASRESIIAFNPRVDQFSEIPMPEPKDGGGDILAGIGVLGGCLCITRFGSPVNKYSNIEILVMKEYREGSSWTVMCSIRNFASFGYIRTLVPLGYIDNNDVLVHVNGIDVKALNFVKNSLNEVRGVSGIYKYSAVFYEENWYRPHKSLLSRLKMFWHRLVYSGRLYSSWKY